MHKLIEALAALPLEKIEEIVLTWIGNHVLGITADTRRENLAEKLEALEALRSTPLVEALSEKVKAEALRILDLAVRLVSDPDEDDLADENAASGGASA